MLWNILPSTRYFEFGLLRDNIYWQKKSKHRLTYLQNTPESRQQRLWSIYKVPTPVSWISRTLHVENGEPFVLANIKWFLYEPTLQSLRMTTIKDVVSDVCNDTTGRSAFCRFKMILLFLRQWIRFRKNYFS